MAQKILKYKKLVQIFLTLIQIKMVFSTCPRLCECKWKSGKEAVTCLNSNYSKLPQELDPGTQVLDLSENSISTIKNLEFAHNGLVNLQKIFLNRNKIRNLEKLCFKDLINLVELDLSQNLLSQVPTEVFHSIPELRELKLSGNPIQKILRNAFKALHQLVRLELSQCKIVSIDFRAFSGLETLSWLKLDNNRLQDLEAGSLTPLENLHGLELFGNPWNCSCSLRPLRQWLISKNLPFSVSPSCRTPSRIGGKAWEKLDLDEFACLPIVEKTDPPRSTEGKNITLRCRVDGIPLPQVRWTLKNKALIGKRYLSNFTSLTIFSAEVQDSGTYTCVAENKAGKAESSIALLVSKKDPEPPLSGKTIILVVLLSVFLITTTSLGVLFLISFRRRRSKARWQNRRTSSGRRIEDHYEKIEMGHFKIPDGQLNGQIPHPDAASKKNGDYLKIPCLDSEMEMEETVEEEAQSNEPKLWSSIGSPNGGKFWQSNLEGGSYDPNDLHIPRRSKDMRDIQPSPSTFGTYEETIPSTISSLNQSFQPHLMYKVAEISGNNLYTSAPLKQSVPESSREVEGKTEPNGNDRFVYGSESNLNYSNLYGTMPKKSKKSRNESQSPLLPGSRYGSGNSECFTNRRYSEESHGLVSPNNNFSNFQKSRSSLNLHIQNPNKNLDTPLLDFSNLESRLGTETQPKPNQYQLSTYDYHAVQLERFLEEYRTLQEELNRMKETCDNICKNSETKLSNSNTLKSNPEGNSNHWSRNRNENFYES